MTINDVLDFLSDEENMADFLARWNAGVWDEWDCGLDAALNLFGPMELALGAKFSPRLDAENN